MFGDGVVLDCSATGRRETKDKGGGGGMLSSVTSDLPAARGVIAGLGRVAWKTGDKP